jgi:hypothetical protein
MDTTQGGSRRAAAGSWATAAADPVSRLTHPRPCRDAQGFSAGCSTNPTVPAPNLGIISSTESQPICRRAYPEACLLRPKSVARATSWIRTSHSHTATCCHYCFSGFERCKLLRKRQPAAWPIAARNAVSLSTATRLPSPATSCNSHPEPIRQTRLYLQLDRHKILYRRQCLPWRALPMGNGKEASRVP